ncbi:hypothetical protein AB0K74_35480 [Streptomyces sp. NPDC056159]|uniref:hypothetical protein n=1 Tax=Streptomyces sp. NPDC056159 TaxID=3155537 RepID=UPI00343044E5
MPACGNTKRPQGLWSAKRGAYRNQPLGGPRDAVADCKLLRPASASSWESSSCPRVEQRA